VSPSAGTKDKEAAGRYKFRTRIRNESDILEQFLYTREVVFNLSLIYANNWQIQGLVKTVDCISQHQRASVVVCVSECVPKIKRVSVLSSTANKEGFSFYLFTSGTDFNLLRFCSG